MTFIEKGQKIDIDRIKETTRLSEAALMIKEKRDKELAAILRGEDERLLLVIGPCSSDNEDAVLEYARRLSDLQQKVADKIFMVMRVYIRQNLEPMVTVIKEWFTSQMQRRLQV